MSISHSSISKFLVVCAFGWLSLSLAACGAPIANIATPVPQSTATPPADPKVQIEAALQHYNQLVIAMNADGIAAMFTANGEIDNPGQAPITGPKAIRDFLASFVNVKVESNVMKTTSIVVTGATAIQLGTDDQTVAVNGQTQSIHNQFKAEWAQQADGQWQLTRLSTQ